MEIGAWLKSKNFQIDSAKLSLPLVHITTLSNFRKIVESGALWPHECPVLRREVLYLSYGDIVFRRSREKNSWAHDPAVALVFSNTILSGGFGFAPLDTGAISGGRVPWFPNAMRSSLEKNFCVSNADAAMLRAWVSKVYGSDQSYVNRRLNGPAPNLPDEIYLAQKLAVAASDSDLPDHTRDDMRVISQLECHFSEAIELDAHLVGVYLPEEACALEPAGRYLRIAKTYSGECAHGNLPKQLVELVREHIKKAVNYVS